MVQNDDKIPTTRLRKPAKLTRVWLILLGALTGSTSAFLSYVVFLGGPGIIFPDPYLLVIMVVGAFFGTFITLMVGKQDEIRLTALAVAALIGFVIPICLVLALFLFVGTD